MGRQVVSGFLSSCRSLWLHRGRPRALSPLASCLSLSSPLPVWPVSLCLSFSLSFSHSPIHPPRAWKETVYRCGMMWCVCEEGAVTESGRPPQAALRVAAVCACVPDPELHRSYRSCSLSWIFSPVFGYPICMLLCLSPLSRLLLLPPLFYACVDDLE